MPVDDFTESACKPASNVNWNVPADVIGEPVIVNPEEFEFAATDETVLEDVDNGFHVEPS